MKYSPFAAAAALAMILALGLALRLFSQHSGFNSVVNESLATSEGYDQKFIDLVNHMEDVLKRRASFAYPGGKDPMTGRRREVASADVEPVEHRVASTRAVPSSKPNAKVGKGQPPPTPEAKPDTAKDSAPPPDGVKLTAIIADDYGQHTAIVMDGERSMSVDVGDMVGARKVQRITAKEIVMEDDTAVYTYDLSGGRTYQKK